MLQTGTLKIYLLLGAAPPIVFIIIFFPPCLVLALVSLYRIKIINKPLLLFFFALWNVELGNKWSSKERK